jgi:hypothetical protein
MFLLVLFTFCVPQAKAVEPIKLYKNYVFGTDHKEFEGIAGTYDCSEDFEAGALCINDLKFIGIDVDIAFRFYNNKLTQVYLMMFFDQPNHIKVFTTLRKRFQLVLIKNIAGQILDIVNHSKTQTTDQLRSSIGTFEQIALASGEITYSFLETKTIQPLLAKSTNIQMLIQKSPRGLREVDYNIFTNDDGDSFGHISFSAPKAMMLKLKKEASEQSEDF